MNLNTIQDITIVRLIVTYLLFLMSFYVIFYYRLKLEKDAIISTLRMTVQLFLAGLLLKYIFKFNEWYIVLLILLIMLMFGVHTILGRTGIKLKRTFPYLFISMLIGCGLTMVFFVFVVIRQSPWYDARYLIPLFGMIVGNSMNSCALALERLYSGMKDTRDNVEAMLSLGATPNEATRISFLKAFKAAILPTVTAMAGMGVVHLPGMMTGQILSGSEPMIAVKYQIAIMLAILSSSVFSSFLILKLETGLFFNKKAQLIDF
jgi:UDP-glucose/iron transport system permease protein